MFYWKRSEKLGKLGTETHACHPSTKEDGKLDVSLGDQMSDLKVPVTSKAVEDWRAGSALRVQTALAEDRKGSVPRTHWGFWPKPQGSEPLF